MPHRNAEQGDPADVVDRAVRHHSKRLVHDQRALESIPQRQTWALRMAGHFARRVAERAGVFARLCCLQRKPACAFPAAWPAPSLLKLWPTQSALSSRLKLWEIDSDSGFGTMGITFRTDGNPTSGGWPTQFLHDRMDPSKHRLLSYHCELNTLADKSWVRAGRRWARTVQPQWS